MPNEFIARNGLIALNNSSISGSLNISGSLGIGTTTPFTTLEIATPLYGAIQFSGTSVRLGQHSGIGYNRIYADTSTSTWIFDYGGILQFRYAQSPKIVFDSSGSIGVGILTPSASLHISGASSTNLLRIDSPASSNILFISGSGNVGIGTGTPTIKLHINTNSANGVIVNQLLIDGQTQSTLTDGSGQVISFRGASSRYWGAIGGFTAASKEGVGVFAGLSTTLPTTPQLYVNSDGNVGIGPTTIAARLQVRGSGTTSATTTFLLQNSTPSTLLTILDNGQHTYSGPLLILPASQSGYVISQSISASNVVGGQYYAVNITPTFFQTTASQTETAFRVAATFNTSSVFATGGTNVIADFGASSVGSQLTVTDITSGSIYMVNDVSGLPIIEATSDWTVNMYNFPTKVFQKTGSQVIISGSLLVSGSFVLPLTSSTSPLTGSAFWSGSFLYIYDGTRYRSSSFA